MGEGSRREARRSEGGCDILGDEWFLMEGLGLGGKILGGKVLEAESCTVVILEFPYSGARPARTP